MSNTTTKTESLKTSEKSSYKGQYGGYRPNSGRKPKKTFEARELFNIAVDERWEKIMSKIDYYIEQGDKDILKFIVEQRIGRSPQKVDMDLNDKRKHADIIKGLNAPK